MIDTTQFENLICTVAMLNRDQLKEKFLNFRGKFPVDLSTDYLENLPLDRLRHIFVALCLQNRVGIELAEAAA